MRILLTGPGGFIGGHVLRALLRQGHTVTACTRNPARAAPLPGVRWIPADFAQDHAPDVWLPRLAGIDAVINCVGIFGETPGQTFAALHCDAPVALFRACAQAGIKTVVQISALGADEAADTPYHLSKRAADDTLLSLPLNAYVLRPSLVYGSGGRSMVMFRALAALPLTPLPDGGDQPIQPLHVADLADCILACLDGRMPPGAANLVGPEVLSLRDWLAAWRNWLGLGRLRGLVMPGRWLRGPAEWLGRWLDWPMNAAALDMLKQARPFPPGPTGACPRRLRDELAAQPAQQADRWQARLYFLRPLLRLSIAFTWLSAGLVSAFFYPVEQSDALLAQVGISHSFAPFFLYGAAALDMALGLGTLSARWVRPAGLAQIALILVYTAIISVCLPEYWLHPFGPVVKNLPLLVAILIMLALEETP